MLCYSKDGLYTSLTTLPSEALQTEALKLFKVTWEQSAGPPAGGALAAGLGSPRSRLPTAGSWGGSRGVRGSSQRALSGRALVEGASPQF